MEMMECPFCAGLGDTLLGDDFYNCGRCDGKGIVPIKEKEDVHDRDRKGESPCVGSR